MADALHEQIARMIEEVGRVTGQGAVYHGLQERRPLQNGQQCEFCRACTSHPVTGPLCRISCCAAAMHAFSSGEPYYYRCWAGLLFVTVPIAPQQRCLGGVSLGGFCTQGERADIRAGLGRILSPSPACRPETFYARLRTLRPIAPSTLRGLGRFVMELTFSSGVNSSDFFRLQNEKYLQQRRIAEAVADLQNRPGTPPDILGDTYQLVAFLHRDDREGAMEFTSRYLAELLMASNWDLAKLKAHVRVLLAVMTSQDILGGTPWAIATSREMRRMARLEAAASTEESCHEVAEWVRNSFADVPRPAGEGLSVAERAARWIATHYHEQGGLPAAARAVGASPTSLNRHLRLETGKTFRDLVREARVAEAKKLLATTALEISEIADRCGFCDQSHFTRVLKQSITLTPGGFRRLLRAPDEQLGHTARQRA